MTPGRRIAVAFLVGSLRFGGAEKHSLQLSAHLDRSTFRAGLAYMKREEHLLEQADVRPEALWCGDFDRGWDVRGLSRFCRWLRGFRPDVLACVNTYPLFYGSLARMLGAVRCRQIAVFHTTEMPADQARRMDLVFRPLFNRCDRIVYVSNAQRNHWEQRGLRRDRGRVIHNGIDTVFFSDTAGPRETPGIRERYGFAEADYVVGICAALRREKHHDDLLRAVATLKREGLPIRCLIIGEGAMRPAIEGWIDELGLAGTAVVTGFQPDVRPFISACDCVAIVSHEIETFSLAALEAMALGKPMIMSRVGGAGEQVADGVNGFLFDRGDVEALAAALRRLADGDLRSRCGLAARDLVVSRFDLGTMVRRYEDLLGDLVRRS